jgi:hypothetical protein
VSRAEHPVAVRQQFRPERFDQAIEALYLRRHAHALLCSIKATIPEKIIG